MDEKIYGYWQMPDYSTHGAGIDSLIRVVHWFMLLLFVGWGAYFVWVLIKFRARPGHTASYQPVKAIFSKYIEAGVVVFEAFLLFGLSMPIWARYKNEPPSEAEAVNIRVIAEQFAWNFQYPGKDGKLGRRAAEFVASDNLIGLDPNDPAGKDDVITVNQLHVPVGKPIITTVSSKDVIHGWNIPILRVKQDTVPGAQIPVWFTATTPGHYEIACAQLCGLGHYRMRGDVIVESQEEFDKFLKENGPQEPVAKAPETAPTPAAPEKKLTETPPPHH